MILDDISKCRFEHRINATRMARYFTCNEVGMSMMIFEFVTFPKRLKLL